MTTIVRVKNFTCVRNSNRLFVPIDFILNCGNGLQIIGNNGVGKTTLLKTIGRLLTDYAGELIIDTEHICYLGHKPALHPQLTVAKNLKFFMSLQQFNAINQFSIEQALYYFNIANKISVCCKELSAGQLQRANLAKLLLTSAKLWLLDEPLINLDTEGIILLKKLCKQHLGQGGVLILTSHIPLELKIDNYLTIRLENLTACAPI